LQRIINHFTETLIDWYSKAKRDLPWRNTSDPYKIWLSEIILQQTRVEQGKPYYERFIEHHTDVHSLADSSEREVLKLWEGLGYYSRARNLHAAAKHVSQELNGVFPNNYKELLKLKGIGPYTAAAIASIAFGEATPVVDGNVFRFASRFFGVKEDISKSASRDVFEKLLLEFIPTENPGTFNQAFMEYGATICTPAPNCDKCVFRQECYAFQNRTQLNFPIKSIKVKVEEMDLDYVIFNFENTYLMHSRMDGIWKGLYQFHLGDNRNLDLLANQYSGMIRHKSVKIKHLLTHRKLWVTFTHVEISNESMINQLSEDFGLSKFSKEEMLTLPRPKVIVNYLQEVVI
jgi:A/G-specific adenine glycosylase